MKPWFFIPRWVQLLQPALVWRLAGNDRTVYLTFDDGPTPDVTDTLLDMLRQHHARATFFCLGSKAQAHPHLIARIGNEGHALGHHTWSHPDARQISAADYYRNYLRGKKEINTSLFRPPYGRLPRKLIQRIQAQDLIVMWEVMPMDFDTALPVEYCLQRSLTHIKPGSIVVLHDSAKAGSRMLQMVAEILRYIELQGWKAGAVYSPKKSLGISSAQLSNMQPGAQGR